METGGADGAGLESEVATVNVVEPLFVADGVDSDPKLLPLGSQEPLDGVDSDEMLLLDSQEPLDGIDSDPMLLLDSDALLAADSDALLAADSDALLAADSDALLVADFVTPELLAADSMEVVPDSLPPGAFVCG